MARFFCKWCAAQYPSLHSLTHGKCNMNPDGDYHELYEGREKSRYQCKRCGAEFASLHALTHGKCNMNKKSGHHEPLE